MKAIKFIGMLFAAAALSFTAVSCDSDDVDDIIEDIENGNIKPSASLKKSTDMLELTVKLPGAYTTVETAKFREKSCVSFVIKTTFASDKLADAAWEEMKNEEDDEEFFNMQRDGKVITQDFSRAYFGASYEDVLEEMESEKKFIETGRYQDQ